LYEKLREEYNLLSKVAEDCYRDALSVYKGWFNNPEEGRFPRVYKPSVWLTPKASYNVDLERMTAKIASISELPILGYPRNLKEYANWKMKKARLVIKDDKAFLKVVFEREEEKVEAKESVAVDINMAEVVVGKGDSHYVRIPTRLEEVHHLTSLAESLQEKYAKRWLKNKRTLQRIHSFRLKAKRIMEDFARKVGKWVVDEAKRLGANVVKLEDLKDLIKDVDKLPKESRDKLYLMQYRRLHYCIVWQAEKHGILVESVDNNFIHLKYLHLLSPNYLTNTPDSRECYRLGNRLKTTP